MPGGNDGYFGYEYQFWASVLLMLKEHSQGALKEFIVESDFGNDAEVVTCLEPEQSDQENEKSLHATVVAKSNQVIQIKTKSRKYQWQPSDLREVLLKQDERTSAPNTVLDNLLATDSRFLFITDGSVVPTLSGFLIEFDNGERCFTIPSPGELAKTLIDSIKSDDKLKAELSHKLTPEVITRVSIIDTLRIDDIKLRLRQMLQSVYGIAPYQVEENVSALVSLVRDRALRVHHNNLITVPDIERIIGKPGTEYPFPDIKESFVLTNAYTDALTILNSQNIVFLVGEPGVGKTTIASALANYYGDYQYVFEQTPSRDAHLSILRSCSQVETKTFLADDIFGYETYDGESQFEKHIHHILQRTQAAKGRVKVIVTARTNVYTEVSSEIRLTKDSLKAMTVYVPQPDVNMKEAVLRSHIKGSQVDIELLRNSVNIVDFEDLLHVRQFAEKLHSDIQIHQEAIHDLFENSRPSAYKYWLKALSIEQQLLLYVLWSIIELKRFAFPDEVEELYQVATDCVNLPPYSGFRSRYKEVLRELLEIQQRLQILPNGSIDFIHPQLRSSVHQYFKEEWLDSSDFGISWVNKLIELHTPLSHSIATLLCLTSIDKTPSRASKLKQLTQSPFVQTIETLLTFGGTSWLLDLPKDESETSSGTSVYSYLYTPRQCKLDDNGNLVRKNQYELGYDGKDFADDLWWRINANRGELPTEEEALYQRILSEHTLHTLNPLERHKFAHWLIFRKETLEESERLKWVQYLASDPISFVRSTVIGLLSADLTYSHDEYRSAFLSLCYDRHPFVKIDVLEDFILAYWQDQQPKVREEWNRIVLDMLDDPVVRDRTAMGLINASENKTYHEFHTKEQQLEWFCTVTPKLLEDKFNHHIHFEDTLSKFEDHFSNLPLLFRMSTLQLIADYVDRHPYNSADTVYIIQNLLLRNDLEQIERDILTNLINRLSPWGRAYIAHRFVQSYSDLPDERLRSFIHRPFYIESSREFIPERVAILLGFLTNAKAITEDLPKPVQDELRGDTVQEKVYKYIEGQDDEFKLLTLFSIYGYGHTAHLTLHKTLLHDSDLAVNLIEYFCQNGTPEQVILTADMLQSRGYYEYDVAKAKTTFEGTKWYQIFSKFIFHENQDIAKGTCQLIFHANIVESVHDINHFAEMLCVMAEHPVESVKQEVRKLINEYWFEISEQLLYPGLPSSWRKLIKERWFPIANEILNNSLDLKLRFTFIRLTNFALEMWETWSGSQRQEFIDIVATITLYLPSRALCRLALDFYQEIRDSLNDEQKQVFHEVQDLHHSVVDEKNKKLSDMSPDFDWSFFYKEN